MKYKMVIYHQNGRKFYDFFFFFYFAPAPQHSMVWLGENGSVPGSLPEKRRSIVELVCSVLVCLWTAQRTIFCLASL